MSHHELHIKCICVNQLHLLRMALGLYQTFTYDIIHQVKRRVDGGDDLHMLLREVNQDWESISMMS